MDFPSLYDPAHVTVDYAPGFEAAYQAGAALRTAPASEDTQRVFAWFIDIQNDFVFPAPVGRLSVPGAVEDTRRTIEWLYHNLGQITQVAASLDTHTPFQIFYASWWKDAHGKHPDPFTVITAKSVAAGEWIPVTEGGWSAHYVEELEKSGRKQLMIWPYHCIEGSQGRDLVPALSEAIMLHSAARMAQPIFHAKGMIAQTEYYSMIEPEVKYEAHPEGRADTAFLDTLASFDLIYVAGQARSHCVYETVNSFMRYFKDRPDIIAKLRFLDDCTSSITGFEAVTETALQKFVAAGMKIVKSTDPIG
jgi:nicotinamidase-related amidase